MSIHLYLSDLCTFADKIPKFICACISGTESLKLDQW